MTCYTVYYYSLCGGKSSLHYEDCNCLKDVILFLSYIQNSRHLGLVNVVCKGSLF